ncbi:ATP-binding protein [uncultured Methanobrevibacter sp.]|uniref:ATP-binding protein n=1 Tax=uncultured Methanobrevibacter sp. TaxID=253161 RepID=UPI0025D4DDF4|nr:ATP-binding protein [uncultured Methanobrevibacter sp.]
MNSITLKPELSELHTLNEFILKEIQKEDLKVDLIVEEVFVNLVDYSKTEFITVNVNYNPPTLTLEFIDNGIEFNPLLKEKYTPPTSIEEAEIGGLGIFLTEELADDLKYHYINGENHLQIIKNVEP